MSFLLSFFKKSTSEQNQSSYAHDLDNPDIPTYIRQNRNIDGVQNLPPHLLASMFKRWDLH